MLPCAASEIVGFGLTDRYHEIVGFGLHLFSMITQPKKGRPGTPRDPDYGSF